MRLFLLLCQFFDSTQDVPVLGDLHVVTEFETTKCVALQLQYIQLLFSISFASCYAIPLTQIVRDCFIVNNRNKKIRDCQ